MKICKVFKFSILYKLKIHNDNTMTAKFNKNRELMYYLHWHVSSS